MGVLLKTSNTEIMVCLWYYGLWYYGIHAVMSIIPPIFPIKKETNVLILAVKYLGHFHLPPGSRSGDLKPQRRWL